MDGASGAFVVPFMYPDLKWDFRCKNVVSINASGHKCAPLLAHATRANHWHESALTDFPRILKLCKELPLLVMTVHGLPTELR